MRAEVPTPVLSARNLVKRFGGVLAVRDVNLDVMKGSVHAIIGPNGAGKTTVFNCITSFIPPTSGTVHIDGERIDGLPAHKVAAHGVARTYQNVRLFAGMTAVENVLVGEHRRLRVPFWEAILTTPRFRHEEAEARDRAHQMLTFVGIPDRAEDLARSMPYGDQRRLEIARALATRPRILMLDEPAAGMNPSEGKALVDLIERIRSEMGVTVLLIEHHMKVVMAIADRITVFDRGAVLAEGDPAEIRADERVIAAYLGARAAATTDSREVASA